MSAPNIVIGAHDTMSDIGPRQYQYLSVFNDTGQFAEVNKLESHRIDKLEPRAVICRVPAGAHVAIRLSFSCLDANYEPIVEHSDNLEERNRCTHVR
jgi:hypothetical protein